MILVVESPLTAVLVLTLLSAIAMMPGVWLWLQMLWVFQSGDGGVTALTAFLWLHVAWIWSELRAAR